MKKVILNLAVSLDGFIEGARGETDWCVMDDDMKFGEFLDNIDTIFYGRVSFDAWGNYQPGDDAPKEEKKMWKALHSKTKYVFSHSRHDTGEVKFIGKDLAQHVASIKMQPGKDIWLYGGARLIKTFMDLRLIDTYKLSVHPVVLGSGKPLFEDLRGRVDLKLTGTRVFRSGVVELSYRSL